MSKREITREVEDKVVEFKDADGNKEVLLKVKEKVLLSQ